VTLTLELIESSGAAPVTSTHVFGEEGGTIGRAPTNSWILPHNKVSGLHARISSRNGVFYIEDTSRNGVCVNSPENRLVRNRPYALKSGDRLFIEPYEIGIWVGGEASSRAPLADPFAGPDPFQPPPAASRMPLGADPIIPEPAAGSEVDPLKFFDPVGGPPSRKRAELPLDDGLGQHYQPPAVVPDPTPPPAPPGPAPAIPAGYNPLADEPSVEPIAPPPVAPIRPRPGDSAIIRARRDSSAGRPRGATPFPGPPVRPDVVEPRPPVAQRPVPQSPKPVVEAPPAVAREPIADPLVPPVAPDSPDAPFGEVAPPAARPPAAVETPRPPAASVPPPPPPVPSAGGRAAGAVESGRPLPGGSDLAALLAGAGVPDAVVTPELTRNLGEILKVVVVGLMDVLQSRQRIKEEFRMQQTIFRPSDNNPLKFSVNVEDALHNLLVKRNPAYLGPVDAFADAFDDLRDHQLAMLAGMRVAFEAMLAEFDPDRMQQQFDAQLGKSSLALVPAKMRYWDLYRARRAELVKDPEEAFEHLFGEEFRRAYEEQFRKLKAQRRARATGGPDEIRPDRD
jgi:predicted component of type VI protein secretion system